MGHKAKRAGRRTDEDLARSAQAGDDAAFSELFERHVGRLRGLVRSRLPRKADRRIPISDVIQEAWVAVFRRLSDFEPGEAGSFRRWLDQIVANKIGDGLRRHLCAGKRDAARELSRGDRVDTEHQLGRQPTPSAHAIAAETRARLDREIAQLSEDHRLVLRLVYTERKSVEGAAEVLGRSKEATRKLYGRALATLSERLERKEDG